MPEIRHATRSDVDAVLALWSAAEAEPTHTDDASSLAALIAHDPSALLVAEEHDELLGSVIAAWDGWRGSIYRLVVAPTARRRGLARTLLAAAQERLANVGADRLQLIVVESDAQAMAFWKATEWTQQSDRARFVLG